MKKYQNILLDWDGCLAKTLDIWLDAYKKVFAEYGFYPDEKTITYEVFGDVEGIIKVGIRDTVKFMERMLVEVNKNYPNVDLYDGVRETILKLRNKGFKLALITTSIKEVVEPALINNKSEKVFDLILTAEDVSKYKPDPEGIFRAMDFFGAEKNETIMVGDSKSDLGAALNAEIDSVLFYPEHNHKFYELEYLMGFKPTYIINEFGKLLEITI